MVSGRVSNRKQGSRPQSRGSSWSQVGAGSSRRLQESQLSLFPIISLEKGFERLWNELQNMAWSILPEALWLKEGKIEEWGHPNGTADR